MKVMTIFGTRPEGIKMAPLVKELQKDNDIECIFLNTAQHREMLDQVLSLFKITPDYDLNLMKETQTPLELTATMLTKITEILTIEKPDLVLVHGDTATTFAGAFAAFQKQIPVGHVEAGLRTNNLYSPFPEEANRQLVSRLATLHFAATNKNKESLLKENCKAEGIHVVGNTVIDALLEVANKDFCYSENLSLMIKRNTKKILVTTHRRENLEQLKDVYQALNRIIEENPDVEVIFPVHKNPLVRSQIDKHLNKNDRINIIEPQDYETFVHLMKDSYLILTDSGGIQEEAPALGKPVLVARNNTERPEGVEAGTLKLCGTSEDDIYSNLHLTLNDESIYKEMSGAKNPYGDGRSSKNIVNIIKDWMFEQF